MLQILLVIMFFTVPNLETLLTLSQGKTTWRNCFLLWGLFLPPAWELCSILSLSLSRRHSTLGILETLLCNSRFITVPPFCQGKTDTDSTQWTLLLGPLLYTTSYSPLSHKEKSRDTHCSLRTHFSIFITFDYSTSMGNL